jgi:hypothetical protein
MLQPDPLQARWRIQSGSLDQEWLHARNPRTTITPISQFPKIASTLSPWRSIWGSLTLKISSSDALFPDAESGWFFLSGMPQQADQGWIHMWDELPLVPETFVPMTTSNNPASPVGSKIVALLENHPRMKNVLLIALDKQLSGYPFKPNLPGWSVPESFVCIDTVEQVEGSGALTISHYTARDTWVTQNISCPPYTLLRLSGWFRVDSLSSGSAGVEVTAAPYGNLLERIEFENPMNWSYRRISFDTGPYTSLTVKVGMTGGPGKARFDALALERESSPGNLLANSGFNFYSFNVHYDGEGPEWWHAHGSRRIATNAPQAYLDFLQFIESGGVSYGWEDRVCLGMHCYHHTASELYPLGSPYSNEFDFYDPAGDSGRFAMIHRDLVSSGLTDASFRVFRFAGHKHQMPAVRACIEAGVKLMDCGETLWQFLLGPIIQPEGVIWETNTNWWCDSSYWQDPAMVEFILKRGELVLSGGHPLAVFPLNNPAQFEIVNGVFQQMETQFPYMRYFFPEEFADFCEESRRWWDVETHSTPSSLTFTFYGSARHGQTIVALLPDSGGVISAAFVDSQTIPFYTRGNRIFVPLPDLPEGYHTVSLATVIGVQPSDTDAHLPQRIAFGMPFPNPCNAWLILPVDLPKATEVQYQLFDALGRTAARGSQSFPGGRQRLSLQVDALPSGKYFYRVQAEDLQSTGGVTILK